MADQLLKNETALRMFFTEPVYVTGEAGVAAVREAAAAQVSAVGEVAAAGNIDTNMLTGADASVVKTPKEAPATNLAINFTFIGKNKRNILLVVNDANHAVGSEDGTALLRNIVKFLKFDKDDFALLNIAGYPDARFADLKSFFKCNSLIAFGTGAARLGLDPFDTTTVVNGTRVVLAPALDEMNLRPETKKPFLSTLNSIDQW